MKFYTNLKSDVYKMLHTPLLLIHVVIPVVGVVLFLWYYSFSVWNECDKLSGYIQVLSISYPVLIGLITALAVENEQKAGEFQLLLSTPNVKCLPHVSKLTLLIVFGFGSSLLALGGFGVGFMRLGYTAFNLSFYVKTAILLSISVLPLYVLQYIVSFLLGKGPSIGLGIVGSLLSALLLTGLGDGIWWFLPWGIPSRFSEALLMSELTNVQFMQYNGIVQSILSNFIFSLIFIILLIGIFNKWEGRKSDD